MAHFHKPDIEVWYVSEERTGPAFDYSEPGWYYARSTGPVLGPFSSEAGALAAARGVLGITSKPKG
jgi:hypothetical protein